MSREESFTCDICSAPMEFVERLPDVLSRRKIKMRRRRFKCTVCDFQRTIYADGVYENTIYPQVGVEQIKEIDRQNSESELRLRNNPLPE